jgi:hypothetical protein
MLAEIVDSAEKLEVIVYLHPGALRSEDDDYTEGYSSRDVCRFLSITPAMISRNPHRRGM